jgi:hypothetical protein
MENFLLQNFLLFRRHPVTLEATTTPMRIPSLIRGLPVLLPALLLALASPTILCAQFQTPTPDELKMTADPKAPGSAAVYLNVAEITNGDVGFRSFYARIKVLSEKGESLATVEVPYEKVGYRYEIASIQGRTIRPDGSVIPLTTKAADLLVTKKGDTQLRRKVFTLPGVEVGSIIEYYYQLRCGQCYPFPPPDWEIQRDYFAHKAHYSFIPDPRHPFLSSVSLLPAGVSIKQEALGRVSLDVTDIPPVPKEEWMPPIDNKLLRVLFYNKDSNDLTEFWQRLGDSWSRDVNQYIEPSNSFRVDVKSLISLTDSDLDKARKIYKAVQALENTDFSRTKTDAELKALKLKPIKRAEDTWAQKSGNRTEIALLYLSMLRAGGLTAYAMRVVNRDKGLFDPNYFTFQQFDDYVILLNIEGKEVVLDPGEKMCPFQTVFWTHSSASGVRQTAAKSALATTAPQVYSTNTIDRIAELTLDSQGTVDGNVRILMTGQEALYWRQLALENDEVEVKKQFEQWVTDMVPDGAHVQIDHFIALADPEYTLAAVVKVQAEAGAATSKRILVPGLFFETHGSHPFVAQDKRLTPVDMHYAEVVSDDVTYTLPAGLTVESAPQTAKIPWEGHAVMLIKSKTDPTEVNITRTFARTFTFAKTDDYQALHDFYQKVAAADHQQLVLTRNQTTAASGTN